MVGRKLSSILLLWSLSHDFFLIGETYFAPKTQSWSDQNLSSIPVDLDVRLRRLDLSRNFIRQLHMLALPNLEELDLSSNRLDLISKGAFENLARLERLNLSRNRLNVNLGTNSKALGSLGTLRSLDVSKNGLSNNAAELLLKNKSSLEHLKMTGNDLIRLSHSLFRESESLRTITIEDNLISEIEEGTFEPLKQLETLNLAMNNLAYICDFKLHQVKYLNLSRNSVEFFVTLEDYELYSLEILDLSYNKLLYFPIVPKWNQLKYLHLQNNDLGTSKSEAEIVSETNSLYNEVVNKRTVIKNSLHANWRLMPLVYIDLSFNHFTSFPLETLNLLSSLETINFSYNCLQSIPWNIRSFNDSGPVRQLFFHSLKHLDLQSNSLVYMSPLFLKALIQIETLNLQDNSVQLCAENLSRQPVNLNTSSCAAFGQMKTLKQLNLRENVIKILPQNSFQGTSLTSLNLGGNPHLVMHENALEGVQTTLQSLTISETNMSNSHPSLPCMPALTELNVSNNDLNRLPSTLSCSPLKVIDIRNNHFKTLDLLLVQALSINLTTMFISGNQFNCCDSKWINAINETVHLPDINRTECFTPQRNLMLTEYLKSPSHHCGFHNETQGVHFGQMILIVLFLTVLLTGLIVFSRKLRCTQGSFLV